MCTVVVHLYRTGMKVVMTLDRSTTQVRSMGTQYTAVQQYTLNTA